MSFASIHMRRLVEGTAVIPVIVIDDVDNAVPLAAALYDGGLSVLEIALRTAAALPAIESIARALPTTVIGAGTVLIGDDARRAQSAGAAFVVSPGYTKDLGQACAGLGIPLLPGAITPTEVMIALGDGYDFLKFFPAEAAGGIPMLRALAGPFPRVSFCPTGGIVPANMADYRALPNVLSIGGSWLTPQDLVACHDWKGITALARAAFLGQTKI